MTHPCPHCGLPILSPGASAGEAYTPRRVVLKVRGGQVFVTCPSCKVEAPAPWMEIRPSEPAAAPASPRRRILIRPNKSR